MENKRYIRHKRCIGLSLAIIFVILLYYSVHYPQMSHAFETTVDKRILNIPAPLYAPPSEYLVVPVEIDDASDIAGMDILIRFDPDILIPVEAKNTTLTTGFFIMMGNPSPGELKVSMASSKMIESGKGALVLIIFTISPEAEEDDASNLIIENVILYDENPRPISGVEVSDGLLIVKNELEQRIPLAEGWNLISYQVMKCFYEKDLPSLSLIDTNNIEFINKESLAEWLSDDIYSPIRDASDPSLAGDWQRITSFDEDGGHLLEKDLPPCINTLHYLSFGYGYWIKMNKRGYFSIKGRPPGPDTYLSLKSGWNLIGFVPPAICYSKDSIAQEDICPYKQESDVYKPEENILYYPLKNMTDEVFKSIEGKYRRITSFNTCGGGMIHDTLLPPQINTLYYIGPKYGFWIKIQDPSGARLVFPTLL